MVCPPSVQERFLGGLWQGPGKLLGISRWGLRLGESQTQSPTGSYMVPECPLHPLKGSEVGALGFFLGYIKDPQNGPCNHPKMNPKP